MSLVRSANEFKYEVAFSFLERDEETAYALNDLLQDRLKTFIYSKQQKDLVGRDGQIAFRKVFVDEARIVVVLYREEWGTTKWTRVEEEAIKERVFEESPDFLVFINLDRGKPEWLSQAHLRLYLEKYGLKNATAIIESRVEQYGGKVHMETVADKAKRHRRELDFKQWLSALYASKQGVDMAIEQFSSVVQQVSKELESLRNESGVPISTKSQDNSYFICSSDGVAIGFHWKYKYSNTLSNSSLEVRVVDAEEYSKFRSPSYKPRRYFQACYKFTVNQTKEGGWRLEKDEDFIRTAQLVEEWLGKFLEQVHTTRIGQAKSRMEH